MSSSISTKGPSRGLSSGLSGSLIPHSSSHYYCKLVNYSLKNDIVSAIFIFGLISTILAVEILSFQFGTLTAKFYEILPKRNGAQLSEMIVRFCIFIFMMALGKGSLMGTKALLARSMRRNLTHQFHANYLKFHGFKSCNDNCDNYATLDAPDQRITEDVDKFSKGVLNIFEIIFISPILIIFYTIQVYEKLSFASLAVIYSHFLLSLFVLRLGMGRLKRLTIQLEQREAIFRLEHVNIRANFESLLLLNSQNVYERIKVNLNNQLMKLLFTAKQLILTESTMEMGKNFFSYSGAMLNFLLMAGEMTWGNWRDEKDPTKIANLISLTSFLSLYLIFQLSKLTSVVDSIGVLNGQALRLGQLLDALEQSELEQDSCDQIESDDFEVSLKDVNVANLIIKQGQNVLISGPNGVGKTSILRYLTGIWALEEAGKLVIKRDNMLVHNVVNKSVTSRPFLMTCPQNVILFTGSLYDLLGLNMSTDDCNQLNDDEESTIRALSHDVLHKRTCESLRVTGLPLDKLEPFNLVRSLTTWQTILTPGQHQRLSLSRALIHRPHIIALDETCLAISGKETRDILIEFQRLKVTVIYIDPTGNDDGKHDPFFHHNHHMNNK